MKYMLIVVLMMGMLHSGPGTYPQNTRSSSEGRRLHRVSLIRVIANPEKYDGENIRVVGCLGCTGLDDASGEETLTATSITLLSWRLLTAGSS